jgi:hypothetical protein
MPRSLQGMKLLRIVLLPGYVTSRQHVDSNQLVMHSLTTGHELLAHELFRDRVCRLLIDGRSIEYCRESYFWAQLLNFAVETDSQELFQLTLDSQFAMRVENR